MRLIAVWQAAAGCYHEQRGKGWIVPAACERDGARPRGAGGVLATLCALEGQHEPGGESERELSLLLPARTCEPRGDGARHISFASLVLWPGRGYQRGPAHVREGKKDEGKKKNEANSGPEMVWARVAGMFPRILGHC